MQHTLHVKFIVSISLIVLVNNKSNGLYVDISELLYPLNRSGLPNVHEDYRSIHGHKESCSPEFMFLEDRVRIMNIKWTDKITNEELWRIAHQKPIDKQIKRKKIGIGLDTHYVNKEEQ